MNGAEQLQATRARILAGTQLIAVAAFATAFLTNRPPGLEGAKNAVVFPFYTGVSLVLFLLRRRAPQYFALWAWLTFGAFAVYMFGDLAFYLFWLARVTTEDIRVLLLVLLPWTPVLIPVAFVLLPSHHSTRASVAYSAVLAGMAALYLLTRGGPADPILTNAFLQQFVLAPTMYTVLLRYTNSLAGAYAEERIASRHFKELALTDQLTKLPNRRATLDALEKSLSQKGRTVIGAGVVMIDIDHFKRVNDRYGHDGGDAALKHVAGVLAQATRKSETVGRWGGEEFLMVLSSTEPINIERTMERVRAAVANAPLVNPALTITVSLGAAVASPGETIESLLKRADAALYEAKAAGRNRGVAAPAASRSPG